MTDKRDEVVTANAQAQAARNRLNGTIDQLQDRLEPARLAREARQSFKEARDVAAARTVDTVSRQPAAVAGAVTAVLLFLSRKRIARLFRRKHHVYPQPKSHSPDIRKEKP